MWPQNPFQKHLCVLFLSLTLVVSYLSLKNKITNRQNSNSSFSFTKVEEISVLNDNFYLENLTLNANLNNTPKATIHILGLFELTTKSGQKAQGFSDMLAAKLAVEHINNFNLLPEYKLELVVNDTKCDPGIGIDTFFHAIYSNKTILMLLGTSCSNVTESLAHIVPYWNILQVSSGSTSPLLSDRSKFPLFFRTIAPDSSHNTAKIGFVKHFAWKVVATLSQSENKFLLPLNKLVTALENANVSCVATITFSLDNYKEQLRLLKDFNIRIIIGSFSAEMAPKIFCEVYNLGIYGPEYVWILQDQKEIWWNNKADCNLLELNQSVEGVILFSDYNTVLKNETSISGLNNELFENQLNLSKVQISKYTTLTYDAVWAMALTLKKTQHLAWPHLLAFNYQKNDMVCEFVEKMNSLNFIGLTGPVRFINGDRVGNSLVAQIQGGKVEEIAIFDSMRNELNFNCEFCHKIKWNSDQIPIAQRISKVSLISIPKIVSYLILFVSLMGIGISLIFLYFNLHFRRIKTVKLSSPKLNNVAVIGCILVYISVVFLGIDKATFNSNKYFNQLCTAGVYLLSVGFSLAFGSMFAKTYRVHRIFTYRGTSKVKDKLLKDEQLIALILIPPIIDAVILILWIMIDPMERQLYNLTLQISTTDRGVVYQPQVEVCRSQNTNGWFFAIYGYKALILIMGVFMAWKTRHIKVQALNDSQYIGICVYSAVFSAIIVVLSSLISEYVIFSYLSRTISILTCTTITLFLLFLPKLKAVFGQVSCHDPIMESMGLKMECNTRRFITDDQKEQMCRLEIQNKVYKCELKALDLEIARLEELIDPNSNLSNSNIEVYSISCENFIKSSPNLNRIKRKLSTTPYNNLMHSNECFIGKFKRIFDDRVNNSSKEKYQSDPEFFSHVLFPVRQNNFIKAKSDINVAPKNF